MTHRTCLAAVLWLLYSFPLAAAEVTISVAEPARVPRTQWPVTSGIPLAQGALHDPEAVALLAADGRELPLQTEVLVRWPDGSVRWLLLDFQVDLGAGEKKTFALRYGPGVARRPVDRPLQVYQQSGAVVIETGPLRLELSPKRFVLPGVVWLDADHDGQFAPGERVTGLESPGVVLADPQGRDFTTAHAAAGAEIAVEQSGPLRACVRVAGSHASEHGRMFRYVARIHAYRGQPSVRFFYTFINDYQDSLMAKLQKLDLVFRLAPEAGTAPGGILDGKPGPLGRLLQLDEAHCQFSGRPGASRAAGWAAIGGSKAGFAIGLREFWQNWPKGIELRPGELHLGICPQLPPGLYDGKPLEEENRLYYYLRDGLYTFKVGVARTHELWATFFAGSPDAGKLSRFFQAAEQPLLATTQPSYASLTKAAGEFPPADPHKYAGYDAWLGRALEAHLKHRQELREYGMLNYGDWYGERRVNWGNLEYDLAHGLFLQYLRTGDRRYYLRAEQAARHHIDVDVVHATNPHLKNPWGPPPQVGEIWLHCLNHTGGYYQDAPLPVERTYQMGHSTNFGHVWVAGDLDYYYLTGDRRAREVALQIADTMAGHCPTAYGTHIRNLGWPIVLVLAAYEATGDQKYLDAAARNWQVLKKNIDWQRGWVVRLASDHCRHGDRRCYGNVPFMEGLTLCALARYHRLTGDPEVLRAISVGVDQMIRECWLADAKTFRYTACPLTPKAPGAFFLSAEALAYEIALTGDREHLRILREGFRANLPAGDDRYLGKNLGQMIHFTPHSLSALKD